MIGRTALGKVAGVRYGPTQGRDEETVIVDLFVGVPGSLVGVLDDADFDAVIKFAKTAPVRWQTTTALV